MRLLAMMLDMDGTIADSMPVLYEAYRSFLSSYGVEGSRDEFQTLNGPALREGIEVLRRKYSIAESVESLYEKYCRTFKESYSNCLQPFPGTHDFLTFLHQNEVLLALVTSAPRALTKVFLESQNLSDFFSVVIGAEDVFQGKPSPEPYTKALAQLGVAPEDAMVVEDSVNGVLSGIGAGIPTVMILHRPSYDGVPDGVVATAESWDQLRRLIEPRVLPSSSLTGA